MSNGCICWTLREDLLIEVDRLALEGKFDRVLDTGLFDFDQASQAAGCALSDDSMVRVRCLPEDALGRLTATRQSNGVLCRLPGNLAKKIGRLARYE